MKGDDPEINTAQTPKRFDRCLAFLGKTRKTFTDGIPNKLTSFPLWFTKGGGGLQYPEQTLLLGNLPGVSK